MRVQGSHIKYVRGAAGGFDKFFKTFRNPGDHGPKYFMAQ